MLVEDESFLFFFTSVDEIAKYSVNTSDLLRA